MADVRLAGARRIGESGAGGAARAVIAGVIAAASATAAGAGCGRAGAAPEGAAGSAAGSAVTAAGSAGSAGSAVTAAGSAVTASPAAARPSAPAGWQELPAIAEAARAALGRRAEIADAAAWGEPARGCYAVWLVLRASGTAAELTAQVLAGLGAAGGGSAGSGSGSGSAGSGSAGGGSGVPGGGGAIAVRDVVAPAGEAGVLTLAFERAEHRGRLRARLGGGTIAALACFANEREPVACEAACTGLLGAMP